MIESTTPHLHNLTLLKSIAPSMRYSGAEPFADWQLRARAALADLLGLPFTPADVAFRVEHEKRREGFTETRFVIQSEEGYFVPCCLWVPDGASGPLPVAICLQGHSKGMHISLGQPKYPGDEEAIQGGDRDFAVRAIKEGYCALSIEQRCFGRCGGTENGPDCYKSSMAALLIGRTTIGERVWDVQCAINALERHFRSVVDCARIILMGNSGGGTTTIYASALEPRIAYAMPSCSFCTFDDSIASIDHCACNFVPRIRNAFDMDDLAGLIAPRPLVIVAGRHDDIFPIGAVKRAFSSAQNLYAAAGALDSIRLLVGEGGHRFYADDAWPVMKAFVEV